MSIKVRIPTPLRRSTDKKDEVEVAGASIKEALEDLERQYPDVKERIRGKDGKIGKFVVIYLSDEDMRFLQLEDTPVKDGDIISIVPMMAGGNS